MGIYQCVSLSLSLSLFLYIYVGKSYEHMKEVVTKETNPTLGHKINVRTSPRTKTFNTDCLHMPPVPGVDLRCATIEFYAPPSAGSFCDAVSINGKIPCSCRLPLWATMCCHFFPFRYDSDGMLPWM